MAVASALGVGFTVVIPTVRLVARAGFGFLELLGSGGSPREKMKWTAGRGEGVWCAG